MLAYAYQVGHYLQKEREIIMKEKIKVARKNEHFVDLLKDGRYIEDYLITRPDHIDEFINDGYEITEQIRTKNYELFAMKKPANGYTYREFFAIKLTPVDDNERIATIIDRLYRTSRYACSEEEKALLKKYGLKRSGKSLMFKHYYLPFQGDQYYRTIYKRFVFDYVGWLSKNLSRQYAGEVKLFEGRTFQEAERSHENSRPHERFRKYRDARSYIEHAKKALKKAEENKEKDRKEIIKNFTSDIERNETRYQAQIKRADKDLKDARELVKKLKAK